MPVFFKYSWSQSSEDENINNSVINCKTVQKTSVPSQSWLRYESLHLLSSRNSSLPKLLSQKISWVLNLNELLEVSVFKLIPYNMILFFLFSYIDWSIERPILLHFTTNFPYSFYDIPIFRLLFLSTLGYESIWSN